jgi:NAD(P)-dependent dehydrogenase (short-subunit alcohol dehydrogenase family)
MFDISKYSLKGRTAIVTGGGRGLGRAMAVGFANAGAKVVVTSRKIADLEETVAEIKSFGGEAYALQTHLGKMEEVQKMVDAAAADLGGKINILVNNAGASPMTASVLDADERWWDTTMNLNAKGLFFTSQAVARIMKQQGGGKIINIASIAGHKPEANVSIYGISKATARMITLCFAIELAQYNIQVNTILPGPFDTKMMNSHWSHLPPEEAKKTRELVEAFMPMKRMGYPDEIVGAALYFGSDASSFTSGSELVIDGSLFASM